LIPKFKNLHDFCKIVKNQILKRPSINEFYQRILKGDTVALGQAITLVESQREEDQTLAQDLLSQLLPHTGNSIRIGITGVPGVGKSIFIETFGKFLTAQNKKVAVLAIDPSSGKTKGSILGDKTRMEELAKDPRAFIRPTATGNTLGGVANHTREAILLCEAAGFDVVIVETVGVGQSETTVRGMVDYFLLLMLAGAGDELQGIKKGIMEMADGLVITKADGENEKKAVQAQADFQYALHLFLMPESGVAPKVLTCSALHKKGIQEIWDAVNSFENQTTANGFFHHQREKQNIEWFESYFHQLWQQRIQTNNRTIKNELIEKVKSKELSPMQAAHVLFEKMNSK
jgi:LAO/AO transport system kinase